MWHVWRQRLRDPGWLCCVFSWFVVPVPWGELGCPQQIAGAQAAGVPCALPLWIMAGGGDAEVQISAPERHYCAF